MAAALSAISSGDEHDRSLTRLTAFDQYFLAATVRSIFVPAKCLGEANELARRFFTSSGFCGSG
jgi:hypothetical protein